MTTDCINTILDFWFEGIDDQTLIDNKAQPFKKWFKKSLEFDEEIRRQFEPDLEKAAQGEYKMWEDSPAGRLALILLYDQFSRNMYRDTPRMYAYDALALELTLRTIREGGEFQLSLIQRTFLYMPLMHFESPDMQKLSVECFQKLVEESKAKTPANTHYFEGTLKYARQHRDTIVQSGRFVHRDVILGRSQQH